MQGSLVHLVMFAIFPMASMLHPASALAVRSTAAAPSPQLQSASQQQQQQQPRRWRTAAPQCNTATASSVITCGRCKAAYAVDVKEFGDPGKPVRCSNCGHEWFQATNRISPIPPDMDMIEYPQEMKDRLAAGKPAEPVSRYRCFVGNLAFVAEEDELRELFEQFGSVASVTIMVDETGRPKGFGFVNMESAIAGAKAVAELDGYELHGRSINVSEGKMSASRGRGRGCGGGVPPTGAPAPAAATAAGRKRRRDT